MIDNILLRLPLDISCCVLKDLIVLKVFVRVDSAHCTISGWRSLCQSPFLGLSHDLQRMKSNRKVKAEKNLGSWLVTRGIRSSTFVITPGMQVKDCEYYLQKCGEHVRQFKMVKLTHQKDNGDYYCNCATTLPLLSALPHLRTVYFEGCSFDTWLLFILLDCVALRELHLLDCRQSKSNGSPRTEPLSSRWMHKPGLTVSCDSKSMSGVYTMCDPACLEVLIISLTPDSPSDYGINFHAGLYPVMKQMIPLYSRLVGLEFASVGIDDEEFLALIKLCPQLQHLSVVGEYWVTNYSMVYVIQFLTQLKTLNIAYTSCHDDALIALILHHASTLKGLFIKAACVTLKYIAATLQACKQLTSFSYQVPSSGDTAVLLNCIAEHGQNLQCLLLHHFDAKNFDFTTLPVDCVPALTVLNIEDDGFEPGQVPPFEPVSSDSEEEDPVGVACQLAVEPESLNHSDTHTLPEIVDKETKEFVPVLPQNDSLRAWLTARPLVQVHEHARKEYYDLHAMM